MPNVRDIAAGLQSATQALDTLAGAREEAAVALENIDIRAQQAAADQRMLEENNTAMARLGATAAGNNMTLGVVGRVFSTEPDLPADPDFEQYYWKNRAALEDGLSDHQIELQRSTARSRADLRALRYRFADEEAAGALLYDQGLVESFGMGILNYVGDPLARLTTRGVYRLPRYAPGVMAGRGAMAARIRSIEAGAVEGTAQAVGIAKVLEQPIEASTLLAYAGFGGALEGLSARRMLEAPYKATPEPVAPLESPASAPEPTPTAPVPEQPKQVIAVPKKVEQVVARGGNADAQAAALVKEAQKLSKAAKLAETTGEAASMKKQAAALKAQAKQVQAGAVQVKQPVKQVVPPAIKAPEPVAPPKPTEQLPAVLQAPVAEVKAAVAEVKAVKQTKKKEAVKKLTKAEQAAKAAEEERQAGFRKMGEQAARGYLTQLEGMIAAKGPMADAIDHSPKLLSNYMEAKRLIDAEFPEAPKDMTAELPNISKAEDVADKFMEAAHEAELSVKERAVQHVTNDDPVVVAKAIRQAEKELLAEADSVAKVAQAPEPFNPPVAVPKPKKAKKPKDEQATQATEKAPAPEKEPAPTEAVVDTAPVTEKVSDVLAIKSSKAAKADGKQVTKEELASIKRGIELEVRAQLLKAARGKHAVDEEAVRETVKIMYDKRVKEIRCMEEVEKTIRKGGSGVDVLNAVKSHGLPYQKLLAERLIEAGAGRAPVHLVEPDTNVVELIKTTGHAEEEAARLAAKLTGTATGLWTAGPNPAILLMSYARTGRSLLFSGSKASTVLHEYLHEATAHKLAAGLHMIKTGDNSNPRLVAAVKELQEVAAKAADAWNNADKTTRLLFTEKVTYGFTNLDEFIAVGLTDTNMIGFLKQVAMPSKSTTLLSKFRNVVAKLLGFSDTAPVQSALEQLLAITDELMTLDRPSNGSHAEALYETAARNQIDLIPDDAERAMVKHWYGSVAAEWNDRFPIDTEKLVNIYNLSPKLRSAAMGLAKSKNSLLRGMVGALLETTTGAAGRNNNSPAIQKAMKYNLYLSEGIAKVEPHYSRWLKDKGNWLSTTKDHIFTGKLREQWNREVAREMWYRWENDGASHPATSQAAKDAADQLDHGYTRMATDQVAHGIEGHEAISVGKKGYIPRIMDAKAWANAPDRLREHFVDTLARDLAEAWGGDDYAKTLATEVARRRVEHALNAAHGFVPIGALHHSGERNAVQKLIMEALGPDNAELALEYIGKLAKTAPTHTKTRLDMQMFSSFTDISGKNWEMWELFHTDQSQLYMQYSHRVSGLVGLSYERINGQSMLEQMRYAVSRAPEGERGSAEEQNADLELFDQLVSEFLGRPFGTSNQAIDNLNSITASNIFGSAIFPQIGESVQMVIHAGLGNTLKHYLPNVVKFARGVKDGKNSDDPILKAFEQYTGIFGYDYNVAFPYLPMNTVSGIDDAEIGAFTRGVSAVSHAGRFLSGFQAAHVSQQKGAAKVAIHLSVDAAKEYAKTGKIHPLVRDMGFDEEMLARINRSLPAIAKFKEDGSLYHLDLRNAPQELVQQWSVAVMRGAGQMIQKTYVGEKAYFHHSSLGRLLTQSRGMSITAMEKQLQRQYQTTGSMSFFGSLAAGAIGFALPLHVLRVMLNSTGMTEDKQEEYLAHAMSPAGLLRGIMNYMLQLGLTGDMADVLLTTGGLATMGVTMDDGESLGNKIMVGLGKGGQGAAASAAEFIPAFGYINRATQGASGLLRYSDSEGYNPDLYNAAKVLPGGRIPYIIPAVNALFQEDPMEE